MSIILIDVISCVWLGVQPSFKAKPFILKILFKYFNKILSGSIPFPHMLVRLSILPFSFLIRMNIIFIYIMSCVRPASQLTPSFLRGKNFDMGYYTQTVQSNFFIPAMLVGTIDFYHCIPLSLTLTLPGVTRSAEIKTYGLHFLTHFPSDQYEI